MTLNKEDFTDEQWAEIQAEADRRAKSASDTAHKKAEKDAEEKLKAAVNTAVTTAVETERAKLEADEQGKLEIERNEISVAKAALAADRKSLQATKKLTVAGLPEDVIEGLLPMFVNVDDKVLDTTLGTFIKTYQDGVKAEVDSAKQELLNGATAPPGPTDGPVDAQAKAQKLAADGDMVGAFNVLLPTPPTA